jgi:hypothetical protein
MHVKVFMMTAGHNSEREVLRAMHDGIYSKLIPEDTKAFKEAKKVNKDLGRKLAVVYDYGEKFSSCDVAVILGSWKPERSNIHHQVRSNIVESETPFICIETPLLGRKVFQPNDHYRVGINGFLNRAAYWGVDKQYPDDRFRKLGLLYNGWQRNNGSKIVIALQLAGDASLRGNDINEWCWDTITTLRNYTDRPIEVRTHPGISEKGWGNHEGLFRRIVFSGMSNIKFVNGRDIPWENQILDAYCVVTYSSGLAIDAVLNGIPVIACDEGNFAWNVGERKLKNIEALTLAKEDQVKQWLNNLAYCQWNVEEMESGECWTHLSAVVEHLIAEKKRNESN